MIRPLYPTTVLAFAYECCHPKSELLIMLAFFPVLSSAAASLLDTRGRLYYPNPAVIQLLSSLCVNPLDFFIQRLYALEHHGRHLPGPRHLQFHDSPLDANFFIRISLRVGLAQCIAVDGFPSLEV